MARSFIHDYRRRCIYHITINKAPALPPFGRIIGRLPDVSIERSPLGQIIERNIRAIPELCGSLRLLQYCIMPDHIHMLLHVTERTERALGSYIGMFKVRIGQEWRSQGGASPVFAEDFHDRILRKHHSLDAVYQYIRDNPRRLAVRRANPDFFRRVNYISINGRQFSAFGNIQLLDNPFKNAVIVHRADSAATKSEQRSQWLHTASNGGVLVSPFISPAEKEVRQEAEQSGGKIILLTNNAFPERYKPAAHDFALCEQGRLLILAPLESMPDCRETFLALNRLAEGVAGERIFA